MRKSAVTRQLTSSIVTPEQSSEGPGSEALDRGCLDREHVDLCLTLRHILDSRVSEKNYLAGMNLLNDFLEQLTQHHDTEKGVLKALEPKSWKTHIELHAELMSITSDILNKSTRDRYLDATAIEGLLVILERHIATLDADLFMAFEGQ